jgi:FkbM family methyltransferase
MNKKTINRTIILILQGKTFLDKLKILKYFIKSLFLNEKYQIDKLIININKNLLFHVRKNEPNDLYMGLRNLDKNSFKIMSSKKFNVCLDIGANIGRYSLEMSKNSNKVFAFEPELNNFIALKENIQLNNLRNIKTENIALSNSNKKINLYLNKENNGGHTIIKRDTSYKQRVNSMKLDYFLKNKKIKKIDLIKIDVEGAELKVFKGSKDTLNKYHPLIIFEALTKSDFQLIKKFLTKYKYIIKALSGDNYLAI